LKFTISWLTVTNPSIWIEKIRLWQLSARRIYGVRIYGIPYGYELQTLVKQSLTCQREQPTYRKKLKAILADVKSTCAHTGFRHFDFALIVPQQQLWRIN